MQGIKSIVEPLQLSAVVSLFALIQPNWNECQQSDTLSRKENSVSKQMDLVAKAAKHFTVDIPHAKQLSKIVPPVFAPEEIERQNHENTGIIIIYKRNNAANVGNTHRCDSNDDPFPNWFCFCAFIPMYQANGDQKAPQYILMDWEKEPASHYQIKRNFRDNRKPKQSFSVFLQITGMEVTFHEHKRVNRESQSSYASKYFVINKRCAP